MTDRRTGLPTVPEIFSRRHEGREIDAPVLVDGDGDAIPNVGCDLGTIRVEDIHGNARRRLR